MIRRLLALCAAFALVLHCSSPAGAQGMGSSAFRSSSFSSGGFGSGGFGTGGFGGSSFGSSGFGSGFGSTGMGGAGFGASRFGGSGFGSGGFRNNGFGGSGFGNSMFGNSGYGGGGYGSGQYGGGQNFVGRDAGDMQNAFNQMGRAGTQFFNQMNRNMRQNNSRQRRTTQTAQNPPQPMRVEVRVGFTPPRPAPSQLAQTIQTRLTKILASHQMSTPVLTMEGDTAVLSGVAASEGELALIEQLVALEPGVHAIRNEMTLAAPPTAGIVPPPGS